MKYTNNTICQHKKIGDIIWACVYKPNGKKEAIAQIKTLRIS